MVLIGVFVVEFPDVFRPQFFGVGGIDDTGTYFDDEVPSST